MKANQKVYEFTNLIKLALEYCEAARFTNADKALQDALIITRQNKCKPFTNELDWFRGLIATQQHDRITNSLRKFNVMLIQIIKLLDQEEK